MEDDHFVKIEEDIIKLDDTHKKKLLKGINVKTILIFIIIMKQLRKELFKTKTVGSTGESININSNSNSSSTKISEPKVAAQQKRDTPAEATKGSEGEEVPNRAKLTPSQSVSGRQCQTSGASRIIRSRKLKDYLSTTDKDLEEKIDNELILLKLKQNSKEGERTHIQRHI